MTKFKVKICGIKDNSIIDCCIENGIDYFGLVFYSKSPRFINEELAIELINYAKNKKITPVGVFVNHNIDALKSFIEKSKITLIQLHGSEDNDYVKSLKKNFNIKVIKSVGIRTSYDFEKLDHLKRYRYAPISVCFSVIAFSPWLKNMIFFVTKTPSKTVFFGI